MPTVAYIFDAARTPRARSRGGVLAATTPVDLLAGVVRAAVLRSPGLDPADVDDLIAGVVSPVGEQGGNIARSAALMAGLPVSVPGVQVNRFCASGLEAVNSAASRVAAGWESLIFAGGVESMSRVPLGSDGGAFSADPKTAWDLSFVPQGVSADLIATLEGMSRTEVDDFAVRSQELACTALADGRFGRSVVPVLDVNGLPVLVQDNHVRPGTTREGLAALPPAFAAAKDFVAVAMQRYPQVETLSHVHTGGNSSGIVDGAAITLIGSAEAGARAGLVPRARIVSHAVVGSEPTIMLTGPAPAAAKALRAAGLTPTDIDLFEVNEAFAAVVLKFMRDLDVPLEKVNVNGGAIALGHPLGATGAILIGTLVDELERRSLRYGLVAVCVGAGMGVATVIERIDA